MSAPAVGIVGLGNMGGRIASRIQAAGESLIGYDADGGRAAERGIEAAGSLAELLGAVDVVLLSLPDSTVVEAVVRGEGGVLSACREGQVLIDLGTSSPGSTRELAGELAARGVAMLDAGISGGAAAAEKGTLTIMVGGDGDALERVRPLLGAFSERVFHMGAVGSGHTTKLLNNFLNAVTLAATAEVMVAARIAELDLRQVLDVINSSSGVSFASLNRFPRIVEGDYLEGGLTSALMLKDVTLYLDMLHELGAPSLNVAGPMASFGLALGLGYGDVISNRVVDAIGDVAGGVRVSAGWTLARRLNEGSTVAFIGLGRMGLPMASRLAAAGYGVRGYDVAAAAREAASALEGVLVADSARAAAAGADAVVLMLPSSSHVRAVLIDDGVLEALADATALIDMSSSEPLETRELAQRAAARGIELVDAPVSGGVRGAVEGTLTIMAGGSAEAVQACRPLFEAIGKTVRHVGAVGAGHALKALNNMLSAAHLLASCEALAIGREFGLDPQVLVETINISTGRSASTERKLPEFILTGTYDAGFAMSLMVKDVGIAVALGEELGVPAALAQRTLALWQEAVAALGGSVDHTAIARWVDAAEGASL